MAYSPRDPSAIVPGILGNTGEWAGVADNLDEAYADYAPIWALGLPEAQTSSGSWTVLARWVMGANEDNVDVRATLRWSVSGGATAEARMIVGADTSGSISTTSSGAVTGTVTDTPTGSGLRECCLQAQNSSGSGTVTLDAVTFDSTPAAPAAGVLSSGYARSTSQWTGANEPIPSERVERLIEGPRLIAHDRPACLLTWMDDASVTPGRYYTSASSTWAIVERGMVIKPDVVARTCRIAAYLEGATGTPEFMLQIGPYVVTLSGTGWQYATTLIPIGVTPVTGLLRRSAGSGDVMLRTCQILREPS